DHTPRAPAPPPWRDKFPPPPPFPVCDSLNLGLPKPLNIVQPMKHRIALAHALLRRSLRARMTAAALSMSASAIKPKPLDAGKATGAPIGAPSPIVNGTVPNVTSTHSIRL